jgi:heme/copper-type cytochrome/quinol oxidase subunit 1
MDPYVRNFVRASLMWLGIGVLIGVSMAFWPREALVYRTAHVHANLLGFVSMMIFGVAYHVMPRFSGTPLHSQRQASVHLWMANMGLALLVGGWIGRLWVPDPAAVALRAGAATSAIGAFLFIHNIWRTLGRKPGGVRVHSGPSAAAARPGVASSYTGTSRSP